MNISITGRHLEVTPSLKEHVKKKVEKIKYYFDHIMNVHVILEVNKLNHMAEVTVTSDEKIFFCEVSSNDMYESLDLLFDKTERQVRRNKEKMFTRKINRSMANNFASIPLDESDLNNDDVRITKVKEVTPKPMTEHEAILQLSLNNHNFQIFKEERNGVWGESIALKNDDNLYSLIQQDQQNQQSWIEREVQLKENHIVELNKINTAVFSFNLDNALEQFKSTPDKRKYIIFHDPEIESLNILYLRKNDTVGLLTSGGKI